MKRLTFGILASLFVTDMAMRKNAFYHKMSDPKVAQATCMLDTFYVDHCLMGEDSIKKTIRLQTQSLELFEFEGFVL